MPTAQDHPVLTLQYDTVKLPDAADSRRAKHTGLQK